MRFLTDLGARKDSLGFLKLSSSDISLIERGTASREEGKGGFLARWEGIRFQLQNHTNPNGHSLLQRIEYWKTAWHIIHSNWLIGVGTGDVEKAFNEQYRAEKSPLLTEYRLRAHNTYLTSCVTFGIFGLMTLLWMILTLLITGLKDQSPLTFVFMMVACSTFLLEDTLETQMGAAFFAFFYGIVGASVKNKQCSPN
jgi:O-antigen ligase